MAANEIPYEDISCGQCSGDGTLCRVSGSRMRELRRATGWSLTKLAYRLGISGAYLSLMETGQRNMSEEMAAEILEIIGAGVPR